MDLAIAIILFVMLVILALAMDRKIQRDKVRDGQRRVIRNRLGID